MGQAGAGVGWEELRRKIWEPVRGKFRASTGLALELGGDDEFFGGAVPGDVEDVGAAADLAVFDVGLAGAGGFVNEGGVPFAAACALVAGFVGHGWALVKRLQKR